MKDNKTSKELLEALAKTKESEVLAGKENLIAEFQEEYQKDVSSFRFKCSRWGDWLEISTARRGNPSQTGFEYVKSYSTAVNLTKLLCLRLETGHTPDTGGKVSYTYSEYLDGKIEIQSKYDSRPWERPLFGLAETPDFSIMFGGYNTGSRIDRITLDFPRPAEDDRICFDGIGATLFTPSRLGEGVYRQIIEAKDDLRK